MKAYLKRYKYKGIARMKRRRRWDDVIEYMKEVLAPIWRAL